MSSVGAVSIYTISDVQENMALEVDFGPKINWNQIYD